MSMSVVRQNSHYISCQSVGKKLAVVEVCVGQVDRIKTRHHHHTHSGDGGGNFEVSNNNQHLLSQDNKDIQPYGESFDEARCDLM